MAQVLAEVRLAGSPLQTHRHVCAFFRSPDEFYAVLLPFIKEGFDRHERALHIVDPKLRQEHVRRLEGVGIDTAAAEASRQLELRVWEEAYLRGGHFVPDAMLTLLDGAVERRANRWIPADAARGHGGMGPPGSSRRR